MPGPSKAHPAAPRPSQGPLVHCGTSQRRALAVESAGRHPGEQQMGDGARCPLSGRGTNFNGFYAKNWVLEVVNNRFKDLGGSSKRPK